MVLHCLLCIYPHYSSMGAPGSDPLHWGGWTGGSLPAKIWSQGCGAKIQHAARLYWVGT